MPLPIKGGLLQCAKARLSFSEEISVRPSWTNIALPIMLLAASGCTAAENAAAEGPTDDGQWQLVWADEFDGGSVDEAKWTLVTDCWGGGNEERQCYTDSPANSRIDDGKLVITALHETASGPALPEHMREQGGDPNAQATKPFTSAKLVTKGKASWEYGKIEVRAKLPQGQGVWPAIWMLPEENSYGTWAASGEIDILEAVNLGVECDECEAGGENTILGTLHFGGQWPDNLLASTEVSRPEVLDGFHTFGVIWEPGRFRWTFDGDVYAEKLAADWSTSGSDEANAPFDKPFHLILNLAIGGGLPEERALGGVSSDGFPKQFVVDWVRVWQCETRSASAGDCGF